jgi:hypothetical protein
VVQATLKTVIRKGENTMRHPGKRGKKERKAKRRGKARK